MLVAGPEVQMVLFSRLRCAYLVAITFLLDLPDSWMGWALLLSWTGVPSAQSFAQGLLK